MLEDFHFLGSNMWVISRQRNGARMLELRWFEIEFRQNCPFPLLSSSRAPALGGQRPRHQFANQTPVWRSWLAWNSRSISLSPPLACPITFSGQQDSVCGIYGRSSSSSGTAGCFHGVWRRSGGGGAPRARAHQHRAAAETICRKWRVGRRAPVGQHCVVKFLGDNLKREVTQGSSCGHSSNIHQPIIWSVFLWDLGINKLILESTNNRMTRKHHKVILFAKLLAPDSTPALHIKLSC